MASTAILPGAGAKRPIEAVSGHAKKLRSKIPRRKRLPLPLLPIAAANSGAEAESSSSCLRSELTVDSGIGFAGSDDSRKPRAAKKPSSISYGEFPGDELRRVTRAYSRWKQEQRSGEKAMIELGAKRSGPEMAISEASGVSSGFPAGNLKALGELAPAISESSCVDSVSVATASKIPNPTAEDEISGVARPKQYDLDLYSDLACSERLSDDDDGGGGDDTGSSEYYSTCNETTQSEFGSDLFRRFSPLDSSDYSLTDLVESPDDFSERSREGSAPSATFSLFLQLSQQFTRLSAGEKSRAKSKSGIKPEFSDEFTLMTFEKDDEESYRRFRIRERKEVLLQNIAEDYRTATNCGDLVLQQRLRMVNWMVEYSAAVELHQETLFLGVSLMDRFLGRGYFVTERNLQLLGIASVTLATRIEENQPYNRVRQKSFLVGSSVYSRCEVVAMEWLLLEALNFRCFLPTIHNFLWFYLKAARANAEVEELARYLASLSLLDHGRLNFWPSTVAAGLVILACLATNRDSSCDSVLETHVRSKNDDLPECIQSLEWLVKYAC